MTNNEIKLSKKAGGSIIDHKPVFSPNSKILYIGCGSVLRLFSTDTGENIQDIDFSTMTYDKPEGSIVDICLHPFDKSIILICFEQGHIISWSFETNSVISNILLSVNHPRVVRMKLYIVSEEYETFHIIVAGKTDSNKVQLMIFSSIGILKTKISKEFDFLMHSWSITERGGKNFLAGIHYNELLVYNFTTNRLNKPIMIGNKRYFTCVACHPTEECVAGGDSLGRVILYYDFLEMNNKSPHYIYHWHTLAVNDIVFSQAGSIFFSGGNEHVLVKWNVKAPDVKHFLPRLSAPIVHLTTSSDNQFVAISTLDNGIQIVDAQNKIRCSLQQFTWGFFSVPRQKLFPIGLILDPRSDCIVMNGKPGHIQFYSPQYSTLIHNMDITCENYLTQERSQNFINSEMDITRENYLTQERFQPITNSEVVAANFSSDGTWLVTSQFRDEVGPYKPDTLLKCWQFERKSQSYKLMSCIRSHSTISKILFQPTDTQEQGENNYLMVTLCSDCKFRFWTCDYSTKKQVKTPIWNNRSIGYYNDYNLGDICFSTDGSLLGAAFGRCLTLWDVETNSMKANLIKGPDKLKYVVFGNDDWSHIAISATNSRIYAWDLLSYTIMWSFDLNVSLIVADPRSDFIATVTNDNSLYIFNVSSKKYVYRRDDLCDKGDDVLSVMFFPTANKNDNQDSNNSSNWLSKSSLYFFISSQELMAFEYQGNETKSEGLAFISEKAPVTPFQALIASQSSSSVEKQESQSHLQLGVSENQTLLQFIHTPAHTMPPVHLLVEDILKSFLISNKPA